MNDFLGQHEQDKAQPTKLIEDMRALVEADTVNTKLVKSVIPDIDTHDNTMMSAFSYCPRLYAINYVERRRRQGGSNAMNFGGLAHVGLNAYYSTLPARAEEREDRHVIEAAEKALAAIEAADFEDPSDDYRTRARCLDDFIEYVKKYGRDPELSLIQFTETAHDVLFPDGFKWGGIIDLWSERNGGKWILDHKTTVISTEGYFDEYRRAPQMIGYTLTGAALSGVWPEGVVINRWCIQKTSTRFDRKSIPFSDWLIAEWRQMQIQNYHEIYKARMSHLTARNMGAPMGDACFNQSIWKANLYNCTGKYGRCSMYDICHTSRENRNFVLENETEEYTWDWREVRE